MTPTAVGLYLSEQLRTLRGQLARLEQLADELALSEQRTKPDNTDASTTPSK